MREVTGGRQLAAAKPPCSTYQVRNTTHPAVASITQRAFFCMPGYTSSCGKALLLVRPQKSHLCAICHRLARETSTPLPEDRQQHRQ